MLSISLNSACSWLLSNKQDNFLLNVHERLSMRVVLCICEYSCAVFFYKIINNILEDVIHSDVHSHQINSKNKNEISIKSRKHSKMSSQRQVFQKRNKGRFPKSQWRQIFEIFMAEKPGTFWTSLLNLVKILLTGLITPLYTYHYQRRFKTRYQPHRSTCSLQLHSVSFRRNANSSDGGKFVVIRRPNNRRFFGQNAPSDR